MEFVEEVLQRPPLVLGVDPRPGLHGPEPLEHIRRYTLGLMEALAGKICAVKFQTAFFEALGPAGFGLMHELVVGARVLSLPVIVDAKRGDIGSTAEAYARAYLEAYPGSALTVNPYLGHDALEPFLRTAARSGGAVFVLVKTSNPGSSLFQDLPLADGRRLYQAVADHLVQEAERQRVGAWSRLGAVVGATYPAQVWELRERLPWSLFLLPGLGAQGGQAIRGPGLLNTASRALYYPGGRPDLEGALHQAEAYLSELAPSL
ncbi:Orotidine 5'-phosphate decarboxylase [Meiothermus luteus]|uniref:Orotidine 5'-phosphate decarboxylase n=1 Tax=Meiothermus luteus TaxID=2026184 RepID=A0A399EHA5_9DEIN|nr:orotidine-5'-phosphate decarboxylase [Meiothermus luteus]RIH82933.1 Orotidine 5'-phosphate decarboxylase [Meiothermus luteus]RMH58254.1 MAG: orotidine-5'-phosphate decarboxylase [Deinococcota bacterium]